MQNGLIIGRLPFARKSYKFISPSVIYADVYNLIVKGTIIIHIIAAVPVASIALYRNLIPERPGKKT